MTFQFSTANLIQFLIWCALLLYASHMARVFRQKQIDIIGKYKLFFLISGVLLAIGLASLLLPGRGLKLGLDFKGGTLLERGFHQSVTSEEIRQVISKALPSLKDAIIQIENKPREIGDANAPQTLALIRSQSLSQDEVSVIDAALKQTFKDVDVRQSQTIGPTIGKELQKNAVAAIFVALLLQLVYIALRFGWNFNYGFAADLALLHDVVMMVGLYAFFGREADSPFLAALLTVIGYSVMDSIVIFDRIRENLKTNARSTFETVVNQSILQTMTRSINTLMTVLFTLFALYYFGGETLKNFAFALLIGVTSGAYSSIFIASPLLVIWEKGSRKREKQRALDAVAPTPHEKNHDADPEAREESEIAAERPISKRIPKHAGGKRRR